MGDQSYFQLISPLIFFLFFAGFIVIRLYAPHLRAPAFFAASYFCAGLGFTIDFFRDAMNPVLASFLTNIPFIGVTVLMAAGLSCLANLKPSWRFLAIAALATFLGMTWFRLVDPTIIGRTWVMNLGTTVIITATLFRVHAHMRTGLERLLELLFYGFCVTTLARTLIGLSIEYSTLSQDSYTSSLTGLTFQLTNAVLGLLIAITLFVIFGIKVVTHLNETAQKRHDVLQSQFSQFLSPLVVAELARSDAHADLKVETKELSVLLVDMRGFTALSEQLGSERSVALVNHFLALVSEEVFARDGTVDKYIGDAVLAFWNAPLDQPDHVDRAIDTGRAILARLKAENTDLTAGDLPALSAVVMIESGACSVGNIGTKDRIDYTAIGPAVNMVSRMEPLAKSLASDDHAPGDMLLLGPGCAALTSYPLTEVTRATLRGMTQEAALFTTS